MNTQRIAVIMMGTFVPLTGLFYAASKCLMTYAKADSKAKRDALEKSYSKLTPDVNTARKWEKEQGLVRVADEFKEVMSL